jgi:hypothetical protein
MELTAKQIEAVSALAEMYFRQSERGDRNAHAACTTAVRGIAKITGHSPERVHADLCKARAVVDARTWGLLS